MGARRRDIPRCQKRDTAADREEKKHILEMKTRAAEAKLAEEQFKANSAERKRLLSLSDQGKPQGRTKDAEKSARWREKRRSQLGIEEFKTREDKRKMDRARHELEKMRAEEKTEENEAKEQRLVNQIVLLQNRPNNRRAVVKVPVQNVPEQPAEAKNGKAQKGGEKKRTKTVPPPSRSSSISDSDSDETPKTKEAVVVSPPELTVADEEPVPPKMRRLQRRRIVEDDDE